MNRKLRFKWGTNEKLSKFTQFSDWKVSKVLKVTNTFGDEHFLITLSFHPFTFHLTEFQNKKRTLFVWKYVLKIKRVPKLFLSKKKKVNLKSF